MAHFEHMVFCLKFPYSEIRGFEQRIIPLCKILGSSSMTGEMALRTTNLAPCLNGTNLRIVAESRSVLKLVPFWFIVIYRGMGA